MTDLAPPLRPIATIQRRVAEHFGIPVAVLRAPADSARRGPVIVIMARHISAYLSQLLTGRSTVVIGREHGGRDHTTIISSISRAKTLLAERPPLRAAVEALAAEIARELSAPAGHALDAIQADAAAQLVDEIAALRREIDARLVRLGTLAGVIAARQVQKEEMNL